ncbi:MAG: NADPH-dependent assimilatory sulfite reductase hemoprotein subunit [Anaerolineae bacterium]
MRITTRQDFQLHGVIKGNLRDTIRELNTLLVTTFGACGDVVRNVMACPAPTSDPQRKAVQDFAFQMSDELLPRSKAYHQIWLDGEAMIDDEHDPLYGRTYLPRKFKIAIAFPGDNCVDIYTNDVGLVALFDEQNTLIGYNILAGGGMGMTHNNEETYPRLADEVCFVTPEQALEVVKAIVTIHRDFGDRGNRKHARLKYILAEWGVDAFRAELQNRVNFPLQDVRPMPAFETLDHLGWFEQGDGKLFLGIPVDSGRIYNRGDYRLRDALRLLVEKFQLPVRLTAQQNILLVDIDAQDQAEIEQILAEHRVSTVEQISALRRNSLACPALPTCGLAISEAERALPSVLADLEAVLTDLGLDDEPISLRMTGCPNGCARPYVSEIGVVGRGLNKYTLFLGGSFVGTRINTQFRDLVPITEIGATLRPVFAYFRDQRFPEESFGDFCARVGLETLRNLPISEALPQSERVLQDAGK